MFSTDLNTTDPWQEKEYFPKCQIILFTLQIVKLLLNFDTSLCAELEHTENCVLHQLPILVFHE